MSLFLYQNSYRVLRVSGGLGEPGQVNWDLALCLLLAWIVCYLCVCKGVKSSGKVIVLFLFKLLINQKGFYFSSVDHRLVYLSVCRSAAICLKICLYIVRLSVCLSVSLSIY